MYLVKVRRLTKYLLIIVLVYALGMAAKENFTEASYTPVNNFQNPSLKSFLIHLKQSYGSPYASNAKELFDIFLQAKGFTSPEEEISFLEFDVLKMKVVDNKTLAVKINNGDVVQRRDKGKISFTPRRTCFVYIFRIEPTGIIFPLFPRRKFSAQTNPLTANLTYFVPPMKKWLPFGKDYGKGAIVIFASTKRNSSIEKLMEYFNNPNISDRIPQPDNVKPVKRHSHN